MKQRFGMSSFVSLMAIILLAAACKPFSGDNETADPLPTLNAAEVQAVADANVPVLLPTPVPFPTEDPDAVNQQQEQITTQQDPNRNPFAVQNPNSEAMGEIEQMNDSPFGNLQTFEFTGDPNAVESQNQGFAPEGFDQISDNFGGGGSLDGGQPDPNAFPFGDGTVISGTDSQNNPFGNDSSGGGNFGELPFDPNAAAQFGGGFPGDDGSPFGQVTLSRYYVKAEQPISLFSCAESTCDVVGSLEANAPLDIVDQDGHWVKINYRGGSAWLYSGFVGERSEAERQPASQDPFGEMVGGDFPFNEQGIGDFPFQQNQTASAGGNSAQVGQYSSSGRFNMGGSGFSLGGNALYDQPTYNNNNGFNDDFPFWDDFPFDDDFPFGNSNGGQPGIDCPPFLDSC